MRRGDLAVFVLQNVGIGALENTGARAGEALMRGEARGVFAELAAASAGVDADHFHFHVAKKLVEEADGVRTAANTGEKMRGEALLRSEDLFAGFAADDGLKIANHRRVRMRAENGAEEVVGAADVGNPVAHGFVDGIF